MRSPGQGGETGAPAEEEPEGWVFGPFELTPGRGLRREDGTDVRISPKPLAVLLYLVRHRDRVVPRRELLHAIWTDVAVSEAAFTSVVRDLRRVLRDTATDARFVATLRGRGLRFVAPASELPSRAAVGAWPEAEAHFDRALRALDLVEASRGQPAVLEQGGGRERGDLLVALARARWAAGSTEEARSAFLDAGLVGRRAGDGQILARAALGYAGRTDVTPGVNRKAVSLLEEALATLPSEDSPLRAELLARLGTEFYYESHPRRSHGLTREAVAMAERTHDPGVLGYVLTARHFVLQRPEVSPKERLVLGDRVFALVAEQPPSDVLAFALQERLVDLLELGEGDLFERTLERYQKVVTALGQPFFRWIGSVFAGTRALLAGRVDEAERAAHTSFELGQRIGSPNALPALAGQLFGVRREQGRLGELASIMDEVGSVHRELPVFLAGHAAVLTAADSPKEAGAALDSILRNGLDDFPRDQNWIATLGTLAPAVAALGSETQARLLLDLLEPYAERMIVVGSGVTTHGAVSYHLGLLAGALGEGEEALRHFDRAEALHQRMGAPLWLERTRRGRHEIPG